jgi:LacI family transcriptional regulator
VVTAARRIGHDAAAIMDGILSKKAPLPSSPILHKPLGIAERQSTNILQISDPQVSAALRFINQRASEPITVDDVAKAAHLSRSALDQRFLKCLGRTPKAEITRIRIARARAMLGEMSNLNAKLSLVAANSGFADYSRFSEFFRRETGMTPAEYRRKMLPS